MDRTKTSSQNALVISGSASVSLDFSRPDQMRITIPAGSTWGVKVHWHQQDLGCESIQTLQGQVVLWTARYPNSGFPTIGTVSKKFTPGERIGWWSLDWPRDTREVTVILKANQTVYRNTCSATLDAKLFPQLKSTPLWLRAVFKILAYWPSAHEWLILRMLWVQVQAINHFHGYCELHGGLSFVKWWRWLHPLDWRVPPAWTMKLQWRSQALFSYIIQTTCYWSGVLLFGMKGEYTEYTPDRNRGLDIKDQVDYDEHDGVHYTDSTEERLNRMSYQSAPTATGQMSLSYTI